MKIRYEVVLDEPLAIDGDWPLALPDGGLFRIKTEAGKASAFEVEYSGKPSDHFGRRKDGVRSVDDERWTRMRPFFAHLKSFIQIESEANFEPTEVFAHYDSENEDEKKRSLYGKWLSTKGKIEGSGDLSIMNFWVLLCLLAIPGALDCRLSSENSRACLGETSGRGAMWIRLGTRSSWWTRFMEKANSRPINS